MYSIKLLYLCLILFLYPRVFSKEVKLKTLFGLNKLKTTENEGVATKAQIEEAARLRQELDAKLDILDHPFLATNNQIKETESLRKEISDVILKNLNKDKKMDQSVINSNTHGAKYEGDSILGLSSSIVVKTFNESASNIFELTKEEPNIITNIINSQIVLELHGTLPRKDSSKFREVFKDSSSFWHPSLHEKRQEYREILNLKSVSQNFRFGLGENVIEWKTLQKQSFGRHALVGMTKLGIVLVSEKSDKYEMVQQINFNFKPISLDVFMRWNAQKSLTEGIVIVIVNQEVIWFVLDENYNKLTEVWRWQTNKYLSSVTYFSVDDSDMVILVSQSGKDGMISADIYQFDLKEKGFWLSQFIPLDILCDHVVILDTGRDFILGFPQNNTAVVYKSKIFDHQKLQFVHLMNITSQSVTTVSGFKMGGYSYLAVGGFEPQILRYHRGKMIPQTILSNSFGLVERWMPISARTHRDDLLILVQHRIDFQTHFLSVLEALIWDGITFYSNLNSPCYVQNIPMDFGITCMLDSELEDGIKGATIVQRRQNISLLVPRKEAPSGLFTLDLELTPVVDPLYSDVDELQVIYDSLINLMDSQDTVIEEAERILENSINTEQFNKLVGNWQVDQLITPEVIQEENVEWKQVHFGKKVWTKDDLNIYVPVLKNLIDDNTVILDNIEKQMIPNSEESIVRPINIINNIPVNGHFNLNDGIRILPQESHKRFPRNEPINNAHIKELDVKHLKFDFVNGIPASELVFRSEKSLELSGIQTILQSLLIEDEIHLAENGLINDINFKKDIVHIDSNEPISIVCDSLNVENEIHLTGNLNGIKINDVRLGRLLSDEKKHDTLYTKVAEIDGDLNFTTINGINWDSFLRKIILKNIGTNIEEIHVDGNIYAEDNILVSNLNGLNFPNDYLFTHGSRESIVTASKSFNGILSSTAVDCDGTIDNINTLDIITLGSTQFIKGQTTFEHIEVSESLDVNGTITGKHLDDFLANPTFLETHKVPASCHFENLEVQGPIFIKDTINDVNLDPLLSDVIYTNEEQIELNSFKTFNEITFENGIFLTSNLINGNHMENFVTTNSEQTINISQITGTVLFESLQLDGLFNMINVTELDQNSIKIFGDQFTEAEIIFIDNKNEEEFNFEANNLQIINSINNITSNDLILITEDFTLNESVEIENIIVSILESEGELKGNGIINGIYLNDFDAIRLSKTKPQTIYSSYAINTATILGSLNASNINNYDMTKFQTLAGRSSNIPEQILTGSLPVENMFVEGNLLMHKLNNHDFNQILENVVWLDRENTLTGKWEFLEPTFVTGNIKIDGFVNEKNFDEFVNDIIPKNSLNITLEGHKTFTQMNVVNNIYTEHINDISIEDILLKNKSAEVWGNVIIAGNLNVKVINVSEEINGIGTDKVSSKYYFDEIQQAHVITDNIEFMGSHKTQHLILEGNLNEITNVTEFLQNIVQRNNIIKMENTKIFKNTIQFAKNLDIINLNDINFPEYLEDLVHIDDHGPIEILHEVKFIDNVYVPTIKVNGDIYVESLSECYPEIWAMNGIFTNEDFIMHHPIYFDEDTMKVTNMNVKILNEKNLDNIITLNTEQQLMGTLRTSELITFNPIDVHGLVNNVNLMKERENTLMTSGDQNINSPINFQTVKVINYVKLPSKLNGKNLQDIAILSPDFTITSPIYFHHLQTRNLLARNLISNIDFDHWHRNSLWRSVRKSQIVTGEWIIEKGFVSSNITGNGLINGDSMRKIVDLIHTDKYDTEIALKEYESNRYEMCRDLKSLTDFSKTEVYFVKYFEERFRLIEENKISSIFKFKFNEKNYLLSSAGCFSHLYLWNSDDFLFKKLLSFHAGVVSEWITFNDIDVCYIISNSNQKNEHLSCQLTGSNIWIFNGSQIKFVSSLGNGTNFESLNTGLKYSQNFYTYKHQYDTATITEYDLKDGAVEEWILPASGKIRFLPEEANMGLAVADGKRISILTPITKRIKRHFISFKNSNELRESMSKKLKDKLKLRMSAFQERLRKSVPVKQKLLNLNETIPVKYINETTETLELPMSENLQNELVTTETSKKDTFDENLIDRIVEIVVEKAMVKFQYLVDRKNITNIVEDIVEENHPINQDTEQTKGYVSDETNKNLDFEKYDKKPNVPTIPKYQFALNEATTEIPINNLTNSDVGLININFETLDKTVKNAIETGIELIAKIEDREGYNTENYNNEYVEQAIPDKILYTTEVPTLTSMESNSNINNLEKNIKNTVVSKIEDKIIVNGENFSKKSASDEKPTVDSDVGSMNINFETLEKTMQKAIETGIQLIAQIEDRKKQEKGEDYEREDDEYLGKKLENELALNKLLEVQEKNFETNKSFENDTELNLFENKIVNEKYLKNRMENVTKTNLPSNEKNSVDNKYKSLKGTINNTENIQINYTKQEEINEKHDPIIEETSTLSSTNSNTMPDDELTDGKEYYLGASIFGKATKYVKKINKKLKKGLLGSKQNLNNTDGILGEPTIAKVIPVGGIHSAENNYIPEKYDGEIIVLKIGFQMNKRTLIAVSTQKKSTIPGYHDVIQIYEDIREGKLFQTLPCFKPSGLTAIYLRDETFLAFLEGNMRVQVYTFRGVEGFAHFTFFKLDNFASSLTSITLPNLAPKSCLQNYLVVTIGSEVIFLEALIEGDCGVEVDINCDNV